MASPTFNRKEFMAHLGSSNKGKKLSPEHKNKISKRIKELGIKPPINIREKSSAWKGGKKITKDGYILLYKPNHKMSRKDGYILEHRYIMSKHIGRFIDKKEVVHHINGNRIDNRIDNLELHKTSGKHIIKYHCKRDIMGRFTLHNSPLKSL